MEQILFLLVIGLIAIVRKLFMEGGLEKILGKLNGDLNRPSDELRRSAPSPMQRPLPTVLSPEEERMRKFREALGIPNDDTEIRRPSSTAPVPPIIPHSSRPSPAERARRERQRIERRLAEKRALEQAAPPPIPVPKAAEEDTSVSKYFAMENFNSPTIAPDKIPENAPIIEVGFFNPLGKAELVSVSPASRLSEIFGSGTDLRRLILAQEILGRPKSLQNA